MQRDYIPEGQEEFHEWQSNLITVLQPKLHDYDIDTDMLDPVVPLQTAYANAYAAAGPSKKNTRTKQQVQTLTDARKVYESAIRKLVKQYLAFNSAISNGDRLALGLRLADTVRTQSQAPATVPVVFTTPLNGYRIRVNANAQPNEDGSQRRGKPADAASFEVAWFIGDNPPGNGDSCSSRQIFSRSPATIQFNVADVGKRVKIFVRWLGKKQQTGPWADGANEVVPQ